MSKKVIAGALIGLTLGLTGCSVSKLINYEVKVINGIEYHSDDQFYKDTAEKFLSYLDARDKEGMKSLLCNALKNHEDIDNAINTLVENFEGNIIKTTPYGNNTCGSASYGENRTTINLGDDFYVITDKQIYRFYMGMHPYFLKHEDGKEVEGLSGISMCTLDFWSRDVEGKWSELCSVDIADISCGISTYFGDSTYYMLLNYKVDIELARILNRDNKVNYDDIVNWKTRDFKSFSEKFGEPYAEETDNDKGDSQPSKVYFYDIIDSDKYARVSVYNSNGMINTLTIEDINKPQGKDNKDEIILAHEEGVELQ